MRTFIYGALVLFAGSAYANEDDVCPKDADVCHKCERIREYNAAHPENNYYYYDDYLKDQQTKETLEDNDQ